MLHMFQRSKRLNKPRQRRYGLFGSGMAKLRNVRKSVRRIADTGGGAWNTLMRKATGQRDFKDFNNNQTLSHTNTIKSQSDAQPSHSSHSETVSDYNGSSVYDDPANCGFYDTPPMSDTSYNTCHRSQQQQPTTQLTDPSVSDIWQYDYFCTFGLFAHAFQVKGML